MGRKNLIIDSLITIDDNGMPTAPNVRQLLDRDIRELYNRDKTSDKSKYIQECIVIYYLGDPKSPARQSGLSDPEALKMAIGQADLPKDYIPDQLVIRLIKRYYEENITEAGRAVENILQGIHNINLSISAMNSLLNQQLNSTLSLEDVDRIIGLISAVNAQSKELPAMIKRLEDAKENLMYEKETELSRGGGVVSSSMDAENYMS